MIKDDDFDFKNLAITKENVAELTEHITDRVIDFLAKYTADVISGDSTVNDSSMIMEEAVLESGSGTNKINRPYFFCFSQGIGSEVYGWVIKTVIEELEKNPTKIIELLQPNFSALSEEERNKIFHQTKNMGDEYEAKVKEENAKKPHLTLVDLDNFNEEVDSKDLEEGQNGDSFIFSDEPTVQ